MRLYNKTRVFVALLALCLTAPQSLAQTPPAPAPAPATPSDGFLRILGDASASGGGQTAGTGGFGVEFGNSKGKLLLQVQTGSSLRIESDNVQDVWSALAVPNLGQFGFFADGIWSPFGGTPDAKAGLGFRARVSASNVSWKDTSTATPGESDGIQLISYRVSATYNLDIIKSLNLNTNNTAGFSADVAISGRHMLGDVAFIHARSSNAFARDFVGGEFALNFHYNNVRLFALLPLLAPIGSSSDGKIQGITDIGFVFGIGVRSSLVEVK